MAKQKKPTLTERVDKVEDTVEIHKDELEHLKYRAETIEREKRLNRAKRFGKVIEIWGDTRFVVLDRDFDNALRARVYNAKGFQEFSFDIPTYYTATILSTAVITTALWLLVLL